MTPAHSCPPQKPSVLSQSQGLSPGPDPGSPRPRRGRADEKGEQLRTGHKRRGRKPRHQADTSATVGSTPCTGLSSDPARSYFLPAAQNSRHILRAAGHPACDADCVRGAGCTWHEPSKGSLVAPNKPMYLCFNPALALLGRDPTDTPPTIWKYKRTRLFSPTLFAVAKYQKQSKRPRTICGVSAQTSAAAGKDGDSLNELIWRELHTIHCQVRRANTDEHPDDTDVTTSGVGEVHIPRARERM